MPVSRVRVEAEGRNHQEVVDDLNDAFAVLFTGRRIPHETEFAEEVIETHIREDGAIQYRGRRVIRFLDGPDGGVAVTPTDPPEDVPSGSEVSGPPAKPVSWVVTGNATTVNAPNISTVWQTASDVATQMSIQRSGAWEVRDAAGVYMSPAYTIAHATARYQQPFYFQPSRRNTDDVS